MHTKLGTGRLKTNTKHSLKNVSQKKSTNLEHNK